MSGYTLTLHVYCGMAQSIGDTGMDQADAGQEAARVIRRQRRQHFPITVIEKDRQWEVAEPADCCMVPDGSGVLILRDPALGVPL
jgi:hypothetical protein